MSSWLRVDRLGGRKEGRKEDRGVWWGLVGFGICCYAWYRLYGRGGWTCLVWHCFSILFFLLLLLYLLGLLGESQGIW